MSTLYIVATPIGNLGDLSPRAAETLRGVERVLAEDTRRSRILMEHVGARAPLVSLHAHNEAERVERVLAWLDAGEDLALVSDAGTPLVSDPGARVVAAVWDAGHTVVPVPGPSAVMAVLVGSGLPADRFAFLGFPERKGRARAALLARVAAAPETVVLFESPQRLARLLQDLAEACGPERRVAVGRELTKLHESWFRGTLAEALQHHGAEPPRGEVSVVVAAAPPAGDAPGGGEDEARAVAVELLAAGLRPSAAARAVAERSGVARNVAYRIVQECSEE